jgi:hypothetical protein
MSAVEVVADAGADESSLSLLGVETSVSATQLATNFVGE